MTRTEPMGGAPGPVAVQARSRRSRRALLDAGFALLSEAGPEALTVAAVSARAGVSAGTVYRRFGDKDTLLLGLQTEFSTTCQRELADRLASPVQPGPGRARVAIDHGVRALIQTFRDHDALLRVFVLLGASDARISTVGNRASHDGAQAFRQFVWPHRDEFSSSNPEIALDVTHRLVYATCMQRVLLGPTADSPRDLSWDELTDELVRSSTLYLLGTLPPVT